MSYRLMRVFLCAIGLLTAAPVFAQTGKISGKVVDTQSRQVLPGVNVIVTGTTLGAASDEDGDFFIINVPPGIYTLQASMIGYAQQSRTDVRVQIDRTVVVDFAMGTQVVQGEEVTISAEKEVIQMDISGSTTYMAAEEFTTAPVTTVADYLLIQEGIEYERTGQGRWLSVRGGGMDETDMIVDGMSTMNAMTTTAYMGVSRTAIKEVSVQTGGFNAEYGRARSGLVNVVTRDGSRQEYSLSLDSKYSFPHLKHFGRNLFDQQSPLYTTLWGTENFIPGEFNGVAFTPTGDATIGGVRGEVAFNDYNAPEYRGYTYERATDTYKDAKGNLYTEEERAAYGMEPQYRYPSALNFGGWAGRAQTTITSASITDDAYPADLMALSMTQLRGTRYGQDPDYDLDVTLTGPLPGERMNNKLGDFLAKSTFMLSYRTQTSRMVFPGSRNTFRDRNLQAKITTSLTSQTKLRFNALYGEAYSTSADGGGLQTYNIMTGSDNLSSSSFYENDYSTSAVDAASGMSGGGRIGSGTGWATNRMFDEGANRLNNSWVFSGGVKLTHTVNPSTYFEMEYGYSRQDNNVHPTWGRDIYTEKYWTFNIEGLTTTAADGTTQIPRTFVTNDPNDIFPGGVAQIMDPVLYDLYSKNVNKLTSVPAANKNTRNRIFSFGGVGTWEYSPELVASWFDQDAAWYNGAAENARKGPGRLDMARALQGVPGYENVNLTDLALLPGSWDIRNIHNVNRLPNLRTAANGGLVNNQTLPGITLVTGAMAFGGYYNSGWSDATGKYVGNGNSQMTLALSESHTGRMTLVSQVSKHHQFKAGADFTFWQLEMENVRTQGVLATWNTADRALGQSRWDVRGNPMIGGYASGLGSVTNNSWFQYYENPFEFSGYVQDKIEVQGLIANLGLRMDLFDPTNSTIDFNNPYDYAAWEYAQVVEGQVVLGKQHTIKSRPAIKWSPRIGLSFPVTETSKVYFNYGWFYQRASMAQYYRTYRTAGGNQIRYYGNGNLDWPRTVQAEMGYEQSIKGWFLLHAAGYVKDGSELVSMYQWQGLNNWFYRTFVNNNFNDIRGFEIRLDKDYGLFRTRLNYNYMLRTRGLIEGTNAAENLLTQIALDKQNERAQRNIQPESTPTFRGTIGFFTPRNWGPRLGDKIHPFDNLVINAIYRWRDTGRFLLTEDLVRPDLNVWVDQINVTSTDLRAEKRIGIGRNMNLGLFAQVFNLFDQKYLQSGMGTDYKAKFQELYDAGQKDLQWGDFKNAELIQTIGGLYMDGTLFNDKRDVFYGVSFTIN